MSFPIHLPVEAWSIQAVDMHTSGEASRIVFKGYPALQGTLLEQRAEAKEKHDRLRQALILEPRGHPEMYGAVLRPHTELTATNEAHIGVLFLTNEGYSTMCGHASIALGRFLVDCHDLDVFAMRETLPYDESTRTVTIRLHAPCGLVILTVPTIQGGRLADVTRPVSFISVPSFAAGLDQRVSIPPCLEWPELNNSRQVTIDIGYGGAFYVLIKASELGFPAGLKCPDSLSAFDFATKRLKRAIQADPAVRELIKHPIHDDLSFLYSVIVVDDSNDQDDDANQEELGLCFFGDQQIDRSPTGGGVAARVAVAYAKGKRRIGQSWTYHSIVSKFMGKGGFTSTIESVTAMRGSDGQHIEALNVCIAGFAYYTGRHEFVVEQEDPLQAGFLFDRIVF
ncbi:uncharacterized protein PV09_00628 [Verruconis gallopava]|uniref:trans-L-3-hydroxyproline dehydratase n=1 Tax=Verruconis gallopava TaxID=253628 RepID=A0A0D1Z6T9_9PEZI|nr:uncharacterized protein PV09_00628 [Verruconis gallopava]KIW08677.1 hypothetical protein PV09_00628 [Verruconis gallopava]